MKKLLYVFMALFPAVLLSCERYDDSYLKDQISGINERLSRLETLCSQMNTNITSIQKIVEALQSKDYITSVTPVKEGDREIGYTITFGKGGSITIYHGQDGHTPEIGILKDPDGIYCWTLDGEWLTDESGNRIPVEGAAGEDGITPEFKIGGGDWWISYDGGQTWKNLGQATGDPGNDVCLFHEVIIEDEYVTFIMSDGQSYTLPRTVTGAITVNVVSIGSSSAEFSGTVSLPLEGEDGYEVGVICSEDPSLPYGNSLFVPITEKDESGMYTVSLADLHYGTKYYYSYRITESGTSKFGEAKSFITGKPLAEDITDLSEGGTSNSYIVSDSGIYRFPAVKGNSTESVGEVSSVEVLWESYGTSEIISAGSLVSSAACYDGYVCFEVPSPFREGNALIAARDSSGKILWSWHIWLTDIPEDQVYLNGAGTVMDRNLGATSATPGDVCALGLLYQWGRKDPFLGSSSISGVIRAVSTLDWPEPVQSDATTGTIGYAVEHPTTFIESNEDNNDWQYVQDDSLWQSVKTIYDPCPAGYRVPDGGDEGLWSTAFGRPGSFNGNYDESNCGIDFGSSSGNRKLTEDSVCWYPFAGYLIRDDGSLYDVGGSGYCWSCSVDGSFAYYFGFYDSGNGYPSRSNYRAVVYSVRCVRE